MNKDEIDQSMINQNIFKHYQNLIRKNLQKELKFDINFNNSLISDFANSLDKMYYNRQLDTFIQNTRQTFRDIENSYAIEAENYNINTKINQFYDLDPEEQQLLLDQTSQLYNQVLSNILQTEPPTTHKQTWERINLLNNAKKEQFWAQVSEKLNLQPKISIKFFTEVFQQTLFTTHLTENDINFINDVVDDNFKVLQPIVLVQQLSIQFSNVFYFEVFNAVHRQIQVNELKMTQTNEYDVKLLESELMSTRVTNYNINEGEQLYSEQKQSYDAENNSQSTTVTTQMTVNHRMKMNNITHETKSKQKIHPPKIQQTSFYKKMTVKRKQDRGRDLKHNPLFTCPK
ncbi:Hypothetical_protein [Hexamita inflata]|uniref:Hypothetical_protein n=1 Tax=Hexamita inflata TaxID=28002 RepID=A0AA86U322_9EUKA|nr:Hypothetical protein HINF_LOCUS27915 [Hexamita inflata]